MGEVLRFQRGHARASANEVGRGTSEGHGTSGQLSENQPITSSYLRAVKVLPPSSSRSKNRQSPAAKRPIVAKLTERASAYADAQVMRFERNSPSIGAHNSRKIPTTQALSVGNFRLAEISDLADKSAIVPTVDQIRKTVRTALEKAGVGPVEAAVDMRIERNYLRDFLDGRKNSIKAEIMIGLSERYGIPFEELLSKRPKRQTG